MTTRIIMLTTLLSSNALLQSQCHGHHSKQREALVVAPALLSTACTSSNTRGNSATMATTATTATTTTTQLSAKASSNNDNAIHNPNNNNKTAAAIIETRSETENNSNNGTSIPTTRRQEPIAPPPLSPPSSSFPSLSFTMSNLSMSLSKQLQKTPRIYSTILMGIAMAFHFGGYEFVRNSALSLFTSDKYGFQSQAAFPLANAFISPFSLVLLYGYHCQLDTVGPRKTLRNSTIFSILVIATTSLCLTALETFDITNKLFSQVLIGFIFLFQNTYQYLLYTQQWSFVSSVCTPDEGSQWFSCLAGFSSIASTVAGIGVKHILPRTGLLGLMGTTCFTLMITLVCQDEAYELAEKYNFDPSADNQKQISKMKAAAAAREKQKEADDDDNANDKTTNVQLKLAKAARQSAAAAAAGSGGDNTDTDENKKKNNRLSTAIELFRRVPTLGALFCEIVSFQSLNSIVSVAFVRALKLNIPNDLARSSYTGQFYACVSGLSALLQFIILPPILKRVEPSAIWRTIPLIPLAVFFVQETFADSASLLLVSLAFFFVKVVDYSIRSVTYAMVYQPLDFESRYLGKEIVGVFGSRFGKSGMSLLLSAMTSILGDNRFGFRQLVHCSMFATGCWMSSTWWLGSLLPKKAIAQATVEKRQQKQRQRQRQQQQQQDGSNNNSHSSEAATMDNKNEREV